MYLSKLAYAGRADHRQRAPRVGRRACHRRYRRPPSCICPLAELVDLDKERERIEKSLKKAREDLEKTLAKLSNEKFTSKAPENVVNAERERADKTTGAHRKS